MSQNRSIDALIMMPSLIPYVHWLCILPHCKWLCRTPKWELSNWVHRFMIKMCHVHQLSSSNLIDGVENIQLVFMQCHTSPCTRSSSDGIVVPFTTEAIVLSSTQLLLFQSKLYQLRLGRITRVWPSAASLLCFAVESGKPHDLRYRHSFSCR